LTFGAVQVSFIIAMKTVPISDPLCHRLREIPDPPSVLYTLGNSSLIGLHSIAIVGSRRPSEYGGRAAMSFAVQLVRSGLCVVSGLASGIDSIAHRGALLAGGYTIAVLGHGLDYLYPASNRGLARMIVERGGCLLSEYPPGTPPQKAYFPRRNRLISGLCWGTIVVQAAQRSGSLITARLSSEQNREVFVVPGTFDDDDFAGSHELIQQGAKLVTHPRHVLEELPIRLFSWSTEEAKSDGLIKIFQTLGGTASLDDLLGVGLSVGELDQALREGVVVEIAPQRYSFVGSCDTVNDPSHFISHSAACQTANSSQQYK